MAGATFDNGHAQVPAHQELIFNGDGALRNNCERLDVFAPPERQA
jgi:hypothetical protein